MKSCPNCARQIEDDACFCMYCGYSFNEVANICPNCGTTVPSEASFCPKCGMQISSNTGVEYTEPRKPVKKIIPKHRSIGVFSLKAGIYLSGDQLSPGTVNVCRDRVEYTPSLIGSLLSRKTVVYYSVMQACGILYCGKVPVLFFEDSDKNVIGFGGIGGVMEGLKMKFSQQREDLIILAERIEMHRRAYFNWEYPELSGFSGSIFHASSCSDEDLLETFHLLIP